MFFVSLASFECRSLSHVALFASGPLLRAVACQLKKGRGCRSFDPPPPLSICFSCPVGLTPTSCPRGDESLPLLGGRADVQRLCRRRHVVGRELVVWRRRRRHDDGVLRCLALQPLPNLPGVDASAEHAAAEALGSTEFGVGSAKLGFGSTKVWLGLARHSAVPAFLFWGLHVGPPGVRQFSCTGSRREDFEHTRQIWRAAKCVVLGLDMCAC